MNEEQLIGTAEPCQVHPKHKPHPHVNHRHHVWPLGDGGPDIDTNIVVVCPTGHVNIHALLTLYRVHRGKPPYTEFRAFSYGERRYAQLGWERISRKAM